MNESSHMHERVMTHPSTLPANALSYVTYEWVMSHTNESCHMHERVTTDGRDQTGHNYDSQSNNFSRDSPYISNTFSRQSPQFQTGFRVSKRSRRHSKDLHENRVDREIQFFPSMISSMSGDWHLEVTHPRRLWAMWSHTNESCHMWMSHAIYMNESWRTLPGYPPLLSGTTGMSHK